MNSVADIWKIVLSRLSQDLSETTISTWFDEVEAVSIKDRTLYLHCPNDFKRSTIESMFSDRIKDSLRDIYSADFDVKLLSTAESTALFEPEVKKSTALLDSGEFTFDTFVVGESNKMAYAAARAVADGVGHYNPLFIYGDSGLGKTHLIYAIAHQIRTTRRRRRSSTSRAMISSTNSSSSCARAAAVSSARSTATRTCCSWTTCSSSRARSRCRTNFSIRSTRSTRPDARLS